MIPILTLCYNGSHWVPLGPIGFHIYIMITGESQNKRFCKLLKRVLNTLDQSHLGQLGINGNAAYIGSHSNRKGAASYCLSMVGGPSPVQVFLRARWSLGNVQNRYIFQGDGGDQVTGRVVCGLPYNNKEFASLPPHFAFEHLQKLTDSDWNSILPSYSSFPSCFKQTIPFLLASLIHHEKWMRQTLPPHHPIFSSILFAGDFVGKFCLQDKVLVGDGRCPITQLLATGIPQHLAIVNQLVEVSRHTLDQGTQIKNAMELMSTELPNKVAQLVLNQCEVNGAVALTKDDLSHMMKDWMATLTNEIQSVNHVPVNINEQDSTSSSRPAAFNTWAWGGKIHLVPKGWKIPRLNCKEMWFLWHFGHLADKIAPFQTLSQSDMSSPLEQMQLTRTRKVMQKLVKLSKPFLEEGKRFRDVSREEHSVLFDKAFSKLVSVLKRTSTRVGDVSIGTLYNQIKMLERNNTENNETQWDPLGPNGTQ